jgi:ABC-type multidrug transport system fused ATPase/permease subunit
MIREIRRGWALAAPRERRRLTIVSVYGILVAILDTIALLLLFLLINVLLGQPVSGLTEALLPADYADDRYGTALILLVIAAALFTARSLLSVLGLWLTIGAANAAQVELLSRLLAGHARAPHLTRLERSPSETLRTVLMSVDQVMAGIVASSVSLLSDAAIVGAVVVGMTLASPLVALTVAVYFLVIAVLWVRVVRKGLAERGRLIQERSEARYRFVLQGIAAAKELQLRGRTQFYADEAVAQTRAMNAAARGAGVVSGSLRYLLETALVIGAVLIVAVAGVAGGSDAALPAVGLVLAAAFRLLPALNRVLFLSNQVQYNSPALDLVEAEVATYCAPRDTSAEQVVASLPLRRELRLESVTFCYPTRVDPALRDVTLSVRRGESIGIVGPTGSGKSTLLDVLLGLLEPDQGRVTLDGEPLAQCREGWQRSIGYVPQDVYLVNDTMRSNVALGWRGEEIDEDAVREAIRLAELDSVVDELPHGLDSIVGDRGVRLSGGQRQRVGLARALYVRPSVLVLDEATSNLDTPTEQRIVETLTGLHSDLTKIVVTHRVSTVRDCDRIYYLDRGVIRAEGTYLELKALVPEFGEVELEDTAQLAARSR